MGIRMLSWSSTCAVSSFVVAPVCEAYELHRKPNLSLSDHAEARIIQSDRVRKAMLATDRAYYAPTNPYGDCPQVFRPALPLPSIRHARSLRRRRHSCCGATCSVRMRTTKPLVAACFVVVMILRCSTCRLTAAAPALQITLIALPFNAQAIGFQATISAPHMHAEACERLLAVLPDQQAKILDVGSGSGYLTAGGRRALMLSASSTSSTASSNVKWVLAQ